ncbi:UNKNOWN [Stylonychia lemnae]|uniref:Uncharacterized protein n=1 Tax=Stylonychia lemnae TaxID=5949 RepID=A0A078AUH8_STYLE|nr:UNKNOWN [Stylonychia lemnae]|eukprot:CDW85671.1 UNKNOWN [Stylonychia lemnae]
MDKKKQQKNYKLYFYQDDELFQTFKVNQETSKKLQVQKRNMLTSSNEKKQYQITDDEHEFQGDPQTIRPTEILLD